jgi:shikimate kinase
MKIFLVGLPGSGKSTLGKQLAHSLAIPFVDLDLAIEKAEKRKIAEIFKNAGEDYFRKVESELLNKWAVSDTDYLMATGGGAPCFFDNMQKMNGAGITIFLDVPPMEIAQRISASDSNDRPLFIKMNLDVLKDQIETLRTRRLPFYKQAKHVVIGNSIKPGDIISLIKKETPP